MRLFVPVPLLITLVIACGGGSPASVGPGGASPGSTQSSSSTPGSSSTPALATPIAIGQPVMNTEEIGNLLTPADFAAVGLDGATTPTVNASGEDAFYIVYKGLSAGAGGLELDVFLYPDAAAATEGFGGTAMYTLEDAEMQALGADDAGYYDNQLGNDAGTFFDELRALEGKGWFTLGIPDNPQAKAQLLALAALVLGRGGALFNQ